MKTKLFLALLFPVLIMNCGPGRDSGKILPYPIYQHQLANGLNVVTVPYDSPGLASFYLVVRVGSREEVEKGVTGFAHFFEHMMFRGTDKYPKEKYNETLQAIGAASNANTWLDRTVYHMTGSAGKLELMFEIEADRFQALNYSEHDFKTEAGAVKGEYTKNYASPYNQMYETVMNAAFDKHTYKHTTMGFYDDIVDMPNQFEYSQKFFDRFYRPEYTTLIVVGDVDKDLVIDLAEKYFGKWERGSYQAEIPVEPEQTKIRYAHLENGSIPPFVNLAYKAPAFSDQNIELPALDILAEILFSKRSDLYNKLVVNEQKAQSLSTFNIFTRDPFLFMIQSSITEKEDMQYVTDEIRKAIEELKTTPVDSTILAETKSHMKYDFAMSIDSPDRIANGLAFYTWLTGDPESLNRLYAMYDKVTAADVTNVANKYFVESKLTVGTISGDKEGGVK